LELSSAQLGAAGSRSSFRLHFVSEQNRNCVRRTKRLKTPKRTPEALALVLIKQLANPKPFWAVRSSVCSG
jgi:hypothetical protein